MSREREYRVEVRVVVDDAYIVTARTAAEARQRYWDMDPSEAQDCCISNGYVSDERVTSVRLKRAAVSAVPTKED